MECDRIRAIRPFGAPRTMTAGRAGDASVLVAAGGTNIAKTLAASADGKTLTVTPTAPLPVESTVTLTLGGLAPQRLRPKPREEHAGHPKVAVTDADEFELIQPRTD